MAGRERYRGGGKRLVAKGEVAFVVATARANPGAAVHQSFHLKKLYHLLGRLRGNRRHLGGENSSGVSCSEVLDDT